MEAQAEAMDTNSTSNPLDELMFRHFSSTEREIAASIFYHLVTPSGIPNKCTTSDLTAYTQLLIDQVVPVLAKLSEYRVVTNAEVPGGVEIQWYVPSYAPQIAEHVLEWQSRFGKTALRPEHKHTDTISFYRRLVIVLGILLLVSIGALLFVIT